MVKIRLMRLGATKRPFYRVVVTDSRSPRDGRFIENIGKYHPLEDPSLIHIDSERAMYWLGQGAQPTAQVQKLLQIEGIWEQFEAARPGRKRPVAKTAKRGARKPTATAAPKAAPAPTAPASAPAAPIPPAPTPPEPPPSPAEAPAAEPGSEPDTESASDPAETAGSEPAVAEDASS